MRCLIFLLLLSMSSTAHLVQAKTIVFPGNARVDYFTELLALVLSYHPDKNYTVAFYGHDIPKLRVFKFIEKNKGIDLIVAGYTNDRAAQLKAVPLPILKGLHGWRTPLVASDKRDLFKQVNTLQQFKQFSPGQMLNWSDSQIIESNNIRVVKGINYRGLFTMLVKHRFDYFPRSIIEVEREWQERKDMGIAVDPHVIIHYPTAYVFFVNQNNIELANDIQLGLESAYQDGEFDKLFDRYFGDVVADVIQQKRKKFALSNPFLPDNTPLHRKSLWLDLAQ